MTIARIIAWLVGGGWRWLLGAAAAIAFAWFVWAVWDAGYQTAEQKCDAAAAKARVAKLENELAAATSLAESARRTAAELAAQDAAAQERHRDLQSEIESLRAARPGASAAARRSDRLLDDACGLTDRGLRLLDGR
ncbi:hypothetical protein PQJ75_13645 [Rhodoplanes sp. TEM]|uniref:Uncharacterized protein n=1 Tax=Rhodoplanes tepidamans TaxID=200616 RepID=A0ABT5JCF2_RHOTP|nr:MULTISPECIES: hypothetical protein [Rhodoplanes]MDC7787344.1 hypothetical protein [Rhodoplanes tepidamans]MDC7984774.1 hypothetical protein [Rhodoplanes sp. TEM]MDQ0358255.1 hypothetical protein [Rhodoplanes tepidamans]